MKVIHKPEKNARYTFPTVPVGEVRDVSQAEAERLIATGAWRAVDEKKEPDAPASDAGQKAPAGGKR